MELIIILLGELIFPPFVAALGVLLQGLVLAVELLLEFDFSLAEDQFAGVSSLRETEFFKKLSAAIDRTFSKLRGK